jgi:hypothetical protein
MKDHVRYCIGIDGNGQKVYITHWLTQIKH